MKTFKNRILSKMDVTKLDFCMIDVYGLLESQIDAPVVYKAD